jgi:hypothetical protein
MLQFAATVDTLDRPEDVLDALHDVSSKRLQINVLGAAIFHFERASTTRSKQGRPLFCTSLRQRGGGRSIPSSAGSIPLQR